MKLTNIKRVAKEELSGAPEWVDPMLTAYNNFMEQTTQALLGKLTYGDNYLCKVRTNQFQNGVELVIANPFTGGTRPIGIHAIYTESGYQIDGYNLAYKDSNNELGITINFKIPDSYVFLNLNANQSIPNAANTKVNWTTAKKTTGTNISWAASPNPSRITISKNGNYLFTYTGKYTGNAVGLRSFWMSKNGTTGATATQFGLNTQPGSLIDTAMSGSFVFNGLSAGDYVELWTIQNSGGALNIIGNAAEECQLTATYLSGNNDTALNVTYILIGG